MTIKQRWRNIRPYILGPIIFVVARFIGMTVRLKSKGFEELANFEGGKILSGWHGRTFIATTFFRKRGVWTMISHSKDGDMQNIIFRRFGFKTIRGSTGRGGIKAAIAAIEILKKGELFAVTPDGPRGPSGVVQGGIMLMARKSGAWIVPVGTSATRCWYAPTWDKYMVPKPFSTCYMLFGPPISVPLKSTEDEIEAIRQHVEAEMHRIQAEADALAIRP